MVKAIGRACCLLLFVATVASAQGGAAVGATPLAEPATFTRHVAPILFDHCAACHRPGGSAPFSLLEYADVRPRAARIAAVTRTRLMPPWKSEPGYGEFIGQRPLSDAEIATIQQWVSEGARQGDVRYLPPRPDRNDGWQLGTPDLVLTPGQTYTLPPEGADRFRVFVLPIPIRIARYVRGVEFRPDDPRVVHHANILLDRTRSSRERNDRDPALGESGLLAATAQYPSGHLLGWTPGQPDPLLPKDLAWPLMPDTDLVVQLHLVPTGTPQPVRFSVGLYFTANPPQRTPAVLRLGRRDIEIPAGQRDYTITDSYVMPVDADVLALKPHAHYRAREIRGSATLPDGSTRPLLYIKDWDFHWQHVYRYVRPIALPRGTTLTMRYTYDNSSDNRSNPERPPRQVAWGPRSSDEMGDLWLQVLPRDERALATLNADFERKWIQDEITGYESLIRKDAGNRALRDEAALLYLQTGRWQEAVAHYKSVVQLQRQSADAHFNLATALMLGGQLEEAVSSFREALRLKPDHAAAHSNLGNVLSRLGREDDALAHYEAAIRTDPGHGGAHNNLGYLLMRRGDLAAALSHFNEAVRLNPRLPDAHYNLGILFQARGEPGRAIGHLENAIALKPDWAPPLTVLGWILGTTPEERLRDATRAIEMAQRGVVLTNRRSAEALDALAAAYAEAGQFTRAIETIREALRVGAGTSAEAAMLERKALYERHRPYRQ
jgi:tetratricopeptide (TPR) repeat protein/mono/diheme cytochrome c family protein